MLKPRYARFTKRRRSHVPTRPYPEAEAGIDWPLPNRADHEMIGAPPFEDYAVFELAAVPHFGPNRQFHGVGPWPYTALLVVERAR